MFAPPPTATLSRAEIQARRAQLQAKRASSTGGTSISSASELQKVDSNTDSPKQEKKKASRFSANKKDVEEIREADKEEWKIKKKFSKKGKSTSVGEGGSGTSLPATLLPPPPAPPGPPSLRTTGSDAGSFAESVQEGGNAFASSPTERKSKAATPKRPARPSGETFLSPPLSASMSDSFPRALTPESFGGSSFRSATSSPATPSSFQAPPPVPGAFPGVSTAGSKTSSLKSPPLPSPPLASQSAFGPSSPPPSTPPPPVPEKSPLRQQRAVRPNSNPVKSTMPVHAPKKQHSISTDAALSAAMAELRMAIKDPISIGQTAGEQRQRPPHRSRAATAPAAGMSVLTGIQPLQVRKPVKSPVKSSSRSGTGNSKIVANAHKAGVTSPTRGVAAMTRAQRIAKQGIKRQTVTHHRRGSSGNSARFGAQKMTRSPTQLVAPRPRKAKGETMTLLQTSGFSPSSPKSTGSSKRPRLQTQALSATRFKDRDLPDTPNSIAPTPTELYQPSRNSLILARKSKASFDSPKKSPLSVITNTDTKLDNAPTSAPTSASDDISPHRLTTIMEYKPLTAENSPPASGTATPIATQIHLRGGSVVTVSPPELTAWQRSIYIQGPIRLPKPVILPRKDSVASMEPFQEAIDRVYQDALFVPRRRSDDAIVDDVCEFFDDFGFGDIGFGSDLLAIEQAEGANEDDVMDVDELEDAIERFTTPPGFPHAADDISPIEKVVAKDVIEASTAKAIPVPEPSVPLPPVNNEETLRARGIARLSQQSAGRSSQGSRSSSFRKEVPNTPRPVSDTLTASVAGDAQDGLLPLLPPPEASMLDAVMEASQGEEAEWVDEMTPDGDAGGMDWSDEDVEETDAGASWTSPAIKRKKQHGLDRGLVGRERRNPMAKMRRFVATATTIL